MRIQSALPLVLAFALVASTPAPAQDSGDTAVDRDAELAGLDPSVLVGGARDMLDRTPDAAVDDLFQALNGAMQRPDEAKAICGLFDADADRSIDGLNASALRLGEDSRQRFAAAVAGVIVAGLQSQSTEWNRETAARALKANGARAAILHDGFTAGFAVDASEQMRCRSLGQMMDVLAQRPQGERVLVTRLLLEQGLQQIPLQQARQR